MRATTRRVSARNAREGGSTAQYGDLSSTSATGASRSLAMHPLSDAGSAAGWSSCAMGVELCDLRQQPVSLLIF